MKKSLFFLLLAAIVAIFGLTIYQNFPLYRSAYNPDFWQERYENSQWVKGWEAKEAIGDGELYAYAGWRQIQGDDPTKINPETPPLGKYWLGLSILLFGNPFIQAPVIGFLTLLVLYILGKEILKDRTWALLPVVTFVSSSLFLEELASSRLDLIFTFFITLSFYFLIRGIKNPKYLSLTLLSLAGVASTKTYLVGFALVAVTFLFLLLLWIIFKKKEFFWFIGFLPLFLLFYLATYSIYFLSGHTLLEFKELHFWTRHFARVSVVNYPKAEIFRLLLLGRWKTWWEGSGIINVSAWRPWWFLGFCSVFSSIILGLKRQNFPLLAVSLWPISLLLMFSFGVPYPRYLLPILSPLFILLWYNLRLLLEKWTKLKSTSHFFL